MSKRDLSNWVEVEAPQSKQDLSNWTEAKAPQSKPASIQYGKIGEDILRSVPQALGKAYDIVTKIPEQASDLSRYLKEMPTEGNTISERWENVKSIPGKVGRIGKVAGRGLFEAAKGAANIDKNANEYFSSVGLPEFIPAFGEELRQIGQSENGQQLMSWIEGKLEQGDRRPMDDLIEGLSKFAPYSKLGIVPGMGLEAIGQNENPLTAMLVPSVLKTGAKGAAAVSNILIPKALEAGGKGVSNISKTAKSVTETLKAPGKLEKIMKETESGKLAAEESLREANEKAAAKHKEFTGTSVEKAKLELAESLKKTTGEISENLSKRYEEFNESPAGKRSISEPIDRQQLTKEYGVSPKNISKEALNMLTKNPTVSSYIDAWRQVRDEASHARKLSRGEIPYGEKQAHVEKAKSLETLAEDLNTKARKSLSTEEAASFDALQKDYKDLKIPLRKNIIKRARAEHPEISTKNFNASISKMGAPELKDVLLKDANFREKLAKHDLMDLDVTNTKKLQQALEGDTGKALPEKQFKDLSSHLEHALQQQKVIDQAKKDLAKHGLEKAEIEGKINKFKKLAKGGVYVLAGKQLLHLLLGL